jgi:hypothetical protein
MHTYLVTVAHRRDTIVAALDGLAAVRQVASIPDDLPVEIDGPATRVMTRAGTHQIARALEVPAGTGLYVVASNVSMRERTMCARSAHDATLLVFGGGVACEPDENGWRVVDVATDAPLGHVRPATN